MGLGSFSEGVELTKGGFLSLFLPYFSGSVWYYLFYDQLLDLARKNVFLDQPAFLNFSIVLSVLMGGFLVDKINKKHAICLWAALMPILMVLLMSVNDEYSINILTVSLGGIFGFGMLSYLTYFRSMTMLQERGRKGGTFTLATLLLAPAFIYLKRITPSLWGLAIYFFLGASTFLVHFSRTNERISSADAKEVKSSQEYAKKALILYSIPWVILCYVSGVSSPIAESDLFTQFAQVAYLAITLKYLAAGIGALGGGLVADWHGRKISIIVGFVLFGVSATFSGLSSLVHGESFFLISFLIGGLSWGVFLTVYTLVVWGDLSSSESSAPFYAAGLAPFYLFQGIKQLSLPPVSGISVEFVSFANSSLFFVSIILLFYAPEIHSREYIERIKLRAWIRRAKKIYEKISE